MKNKRGRVAVFGVFTALALIFSYVELLIPIKFGIPGGKARPGQSGDYYRPLQN